MQNKFLEIAFSDGVRRAQEKYGSRKHYARFEDGVPAPEIKLSESEIEFISQRDGFYLATVGEQGQPYIQFRGGPAGFLKVLDERTLGFADFRGNLQCISTGNLESNNKVALFLMDYANKARLKIFAEAEVKAADDSPDLVDVLKVKDYQAKIERAIILHVKAFDWNCPQHITQRFTAEEIRDAVRPLHEHIAKLEKEIVELKAIKK